MNRWTLLVIGSTVYVSTLIAMAPATLVDAGLQHLSHGQLQLAEARGTLWCGAGQLEILDMKTKTGIARAISWNLVSSSLLRGKMVYRIGIDQHSQNPAVNVFLVTLSRSDVVLENMEINLPVAVLGMVIPKLAALELGGDMHITMPRLSIAQNSLEGNATLQWHSTRSALLPISPIGDYELSITGRGSTAQATLHTLQGPLQLDGEGLWMKGHSARFFATAHIPPSLYSQLAPFLRLVAVEQSDGSFKWIPDDH
jgi:general secretion pathway protein N